MFTLPTLQQLARLICRGAISATYVVELAGASIGISEGHAGTIDLSKCHCALLVWGVIVD